MRVLLSSTVESAEAHNMRSLADIAKGIDLAMAELRDTISAAEPAQIADSGLGGVLAASMHNASLPVVLDDKVRLRHPMRAELAIYFACREAVQNATNHAGTGATVWIRLIEIPGGLSFAVTDDGVGFDATEGHHGIGLLSIRERIETAGGRVTISSRRGWGATISGFVPDQLSAPLTDPDAAPAIVRVSNTLAATHARLRREILLETDTERRRIMRDLHDGAQQRLVALRVKIGLTTERCSAKSIEHRLLIRLATELDAAIAELRDLARWLLLPAESAAAGLALRGVTRHWPMKIQIRERRVGRRHAAVEEAVYRCCLEALQHARATVTQPTAGATRATVSIFERDRAVHFVVRGTSGFDSANDLNRQSLANMVDRAALVGGSLTVSDLGRQGHIVRGSIPIAGPL